MIKVMMSMTMLYVFVTTAFTAEISVVKESKDKKLLEDRPIKFLKE